MSYALTTLWYERQRYLPGVLAVGFSALLIALQAGLLLSTPYPRSVPCELLYRAIQDATGLQPRHRGEDREARKAMCSRAGGSPETS